MTKDFPHYICHCELTFVRIKIIFLFNRLHRLNSLTLPTPFYLQYSVTGIFITIFVVYFVKPR